jgi:RNA polymerase sigma factor (sigma-70 family)
MMSPAMSADQGPPGPRAGDAFAEEVAALRPLVRAVAAATMSASRDHADVEDVTHETMRRALEGRARLRDGEPLRPWVTGIARHVALDLLRAKKRARAREGEGEMELVADPAPTPSERLVIAQRDAAIARAMDELPAKTRQALRFFHVDGLGYAEIAKRMGVPLGTVATWVARGRKQIADSVQARRES